MKKSKLSAVLVIFLVLFGIKTLFPEQTALVISSAASVFRGELDYRAIFSDFGESISVFSKQENSQSALIQGENDAQAETALLTDTAFNLGERQTLSMPAPNPQPQLPAAVSAFLESQKAFSEYELPENVSYEYMIFPDTWSVPVAGYNSSGFGYRLHPIHGDVRFHYGTDFAAWSGENILCFADGTVSFAGYCDSYGNYITVDHADGWQSLYAHCSRLLVSAGDTVSAGELIALVGDTGLVTGPHLHFELSHNGIYVNPEYYVNS